MAVITSTPGYQAVSGFAPVAGLDTPCGGVAAGLPAASPGFSSVTLQVDLGSAYPITDATATLWYAGTGVDFSYSNSSDGVTWSSWISTLNTGGNHAGVFSSAPVALSVFGIYRYWRLSYQEVPQSGYTTSLITANLLQMYVGLTPVIPITGGACDYCGSSGSLTISGYYTRNAEHGAAGAIPHENCPMTLWYKMCASPMAAPCAHNPANFDSFPGSQICIDGTIGMAQTTTDCTGFYTFSLTGVITGFLVGPGSYIENPAYTGCDEAFVPIPAGGAAQQWVLDGPSSVAFGCAADTSWKVTEPGGAIATGSNPPGGELSSAAWIFAEEDLGAGPCVGTAPSTSTCYACSYSGTGIVGRQNTPLFDTSLGKYVANPITGSWTADLWSPSPLSPIHYYTKDGKFYTVSGVGVVVSDSCGNTDSTYGGSGTPATDWYNWVSGSVSLQNWTPGTCSPPLYTPFLGPDGVHNLLVQGPFDTLNTGDVQIYPNPFSMSGLCLMGGLSYGVQLQPPCTGVQTERLQADMSKDVLAVAWVGSAGGALNTICHRGPSKHIGSSTVGWEAAHTVESAAADDIGMVFLPNESLYLTYLLSGSPVYRLNKMFGSGADWSTTGSPNPLVARHSASGRGEGQAFRFRALGTPTTNGNLEFSQCRDNRGALWTAGEDDSSSIVITESAQGPWCGGIFVENACICLYSLAQTVPGLAAAGSLCMAKSVDGGQTWALTFTGYSGQCGGIARTRQGVLVAVVLTTSSPISGLPGLFGTAWLQSRNGGEGWANEFKFGLSVPALALPPAIAAQEDIVYTVWVTGDQPQFLASRDGGISWY